MPPFTTAFLFTVLFGAAVGFLIRLAAYWRRTGRYRPAEGSIGALAGAAVAVILGALDWYLSHGRAVEELPGVVLTFGGVAIVGVVAVRTAGAFMGNDGRVSAGAGITITELVLATALAMLLLHALSAPLAVATWPLAELINRGPNQLVLPITLGINAGAILLAILLLRWARGRMVWARLLFDVAGYVCLVFLTETALAYLGSEIRSFFEVPFANVTQVDMSAPKVKVLLSLILPSAGIAFLLWVARRKGDSHHIPLSEKT